MSDLKPCPFCGGEEELMIDELDMSSNAGTVMCMTCYAVSPDEDDWNNAVAAWNARTSPEDELKERFDDKCKEVLIQAETIQSQQAEIERLRENIKVSQDNFEVSCDQNEHKSSEIERLIKFEKSTFDTLKKMLSEVQSERNKLQARVRELETEIERLTPYLEEYKKAAECFWLRKDFERGLKELIWELQARLSRSQVGAQDKGREIHHLQARVRELEGALRGLLDLIEHPSHDHDDTLPEIIRANKVLNKFRKVLAGAEKALSSTKELTPDASDDQTAGDQLND
ncbi:Lar family restriction alleviation protein [Kiloniella laminariae]|uniref:Lar family restriction alleviation protein n=1 Tax=Kiloniella laminariae TaxID=454162 RepID=UPI0003697473|nr:Lar family restriction alleviation protein [Kiloniella laminariae]